MSTRSLPPRTAAVFVLTGFLILLAGACTAPLPERSTGPSGPVYDPATDPLVNPPTLTEPYPFDRPEVVARDDTLVRYMLGDPRTLNPIFAIFWEDYYLSGALFQSLTTRNADMTTVWNQTMVEEGVIADDWKSARVRIRPGLTWHDGKPWTMHDLKFTYDMVASDDVPAAMYKHDVDQIERIDVIDDLTVEFHFKDALVTNMLAMRVPPIPRHIWNNPEELENDPTMRSSEYFNHYAREEVIGSGPYRFVSWTLTDRIVVDRWDDFPDAARIAPFRRVIYRPQSDRNLGLLLFKKGELDEYWFTPQQFATQSNDEEFKRFGVKGWAPARRISRIGWNQDGSNPFFTDVRVRRAMTHAYDQKRVIRDVAYGVYLETDQLWDKDHMGYNPDVPKYPFDLERAGELLDEAGWLSDPDDGWRYKEIGGEKVKFSFELEIAQTFADAVKMADIYREDLRSIGVELTLRQYENATHEQHLLEHEFQAHADADEVTTDPDQWTIRLHSTSYDNARNYVGYRSDRVDELLERGRREFDPEARAAIYRELAYVVAEDQPFTMMWNYSEIRAFSKRLRGVEFAPSGVFLFQPTPPPGSDWWTSPGWWTHREDVAAYASGG